MDVEILMDKLVPFKLHYYFLRVVIIRIRCQVDIVGVVETWTFPGFMVWYQRDDLVSTGYRPLGVCELPWRRFIHAISQHIEAGESAVSHHVICRADIAILENDVIRCSLVVYRLLSE